MPRPASGGERRPTPASPRWCAALLVGAAAAALLIVPTTADPASAAGGGAAQASAPDTGAGPRPTTTAALEFR